MGPFLDGNYFEDLGRITPNLASFNDVDTIRGYISSFMANAD